ncbi:MAG TPA: HAD-IA family hydrolase [Acidimicrobiales bacterium]|nr:HAD-IA family hydrolase [Acidimicrobiales bacterium]
MTFDFWNTLVWEPPGNLVAGRMRAWAALLDAAGIGVERTRLEAAHGVAFREYESAWKANRQYVVADATACMLAQLGIDAGRDLQEALVRSFGEAGATTELHPADGVEECLRALRAEGRRLGIVCDIGLTPSTTLIELLDRWQLLDLFDAWTFSDEVGFYKPDPRIFEVALDALGVAPERSAHVGDRVRTDVQGARNMGMVPVRYAGVYDDPDQVAGDAGIVIAHLSELPAALEEAAP